MARLLVVLALVVSTTSVAQAADLEFAGAFSEIESSTPGCEEIFAVTDYTTKHFFLSSSLTIVTVFEGDGGFFDSLLFASNLGYQNDFLYEDEVSVAGETYAVEIYGFLDEDFVYMEAQVAELDGDGDVLCTASANFTGFVPQP